MRALPPVLAAIALLVAASCFYDFNKSLGACVDAGGCKSDSGSTGQDAGATDAGADGSVGTDAGWDAGRSGTNLTLDAGWISPLSWISGVWGDESGVVWVAGDGGVEVDRGQGVFIDAGLGGRFLTAITGNGPRNVWVVAQGFIATQTGSLNSNFDDAPNNQFLQPGDWRCAAVSAVELWVAGTESAAGLFKSHAVGGTDWTNWLDPSQGNAPIWTAGWLSDGGDFWIGSSVGSVGEVNDGGYWQLDPTATATMTALWGDDLGHVFAASRATDAGDIWMYSDGGWAHAASSVPLAALWGSGFNDVWAVGAGGTVLHFDGQGWTTIDAGWAAGRVPDLSGVWGRGTDLWLVGNLDAGVIFHFTR